MTESDSPEWIRRFTDEESARIVADELGPDPARALPLTGFTFAAKDNIDVAGVPSSAAFPARAGRPAAASATALPELLPPDTCSGCPTAWHAP